MYAPDARFEDAVFRLRGEEIGRMWRSLLGRAREFSVTYTIAQAATRPRARSSGRPATSSGAAVPSST